MTALNEIKEDLQSLFQNNKVKRAEALNAGLNRNFISENCVPMYFTGKHDASTVLVMLNPCNENNQYSFKDDPATQNVSFEQYCLQYMDDHIHYGKKFRSNKIDAFDLKQAAFLMPFIHSGIELPDFIEDSHQKLNAQVNVLTQKLQLELIPYCSREFGGVLDNTEQAMANIEVMATFLEIVLENIIAHKRKYVIFCAKQFLHLFTAYHKTGRGEVVLGKMMSEQIEGLAKKVYFNPVIIHYKGHKIQAGVACSFPRRDLPNAYSKMRAYGRFCFQQMQSSDN
jgi:hypothetical protein